jgi:branched-chain amino acid transport system substrate-binding protein
VTKVLLPIVIILTIILTLQLTGVFNSPKQDNINQNQDNFTLDQNNVIRIGIIGPMAYLQGQHNWLGAQMAADEINAAGGVKVGADTYYIKLIQTESNEVFSITDAAAAMDKLITVDKADFVMGGFRTEAVTPMQEIAMDNHKIFLGCGAASTSLNSVVKSDYNRYKYWFRVTPFVSTKLVDNTMMELAMAGAILKEESGIQRKLRAAVCAEGAQWADSMTSIMNSYIPSKLGMEVSGTWRPAITATQLNFEMAAIQAANTDIICTIISGPLGISYAKSLGELKVPAASVGINVESQSLGFPDATGGYGAYETSLNTYAQGLGISPLTSPFVDDFVAKSGGDLPTVSAGTYDAVYILAHAIARAGTLDSDAVVAELEKTSEPTTLSPNFTFTGMAAELGNPHDATYGPGAYTGIATQWQSRKMVAVWPNPTYAAAYKAAGYSDAWKDVNYQGIAKWQAPPQLISRLKSEVAR